MNSVATNKKEIKNEQIITKCALNVRFLIKSEVCLGARRTKM